MEQICTPATVDGYAEAESAAAHYVTNHGRRELERVENVYS